MEPLTLITTALLFGATEAGRGTLAEAGKDAYSNLKALIIKHFAFNAQAKRALEDHENDPETYEKPLVKAIQEAKVDQDEQVLKQAQTLLALADPAGSVQGKYNVIISGGQGSQVGDNNNQINNFGTPPTS